MPIDRIVDLTNVQEQGSLVHSSHSDWHHPAQCVYGKYHMSRSRCAANIGLVLGAMKRDAEAREAYVEAVEILSVVAGPNHPRLRRWQRSINEIDERSGAPDSSTS